MRQPSSTRFGRRAFGLTGVAVLTTVLACASLDGLQGAEGDEDGGARPNDAMADRTVDDGSSQVPVGTVDSALGDANVGDAMATADASTTGDASTASADATATGDGSTTGDATATGDGSTTGDAEGPDASIPTDSGATDSAAPTDASTSDARNAEGGTDGASDAAMDAATDTGAPLSRAQCGPVTTSSSGLGADTNFFVGWRFEVPAGGMHVRRVGAGVAANGVSVTMFAALVALTGPGDVPDATNLTGNDLRSTSLIPVPANTSGEVFANVDLILAPGWYAEFFGTGSFGSPGGFVNLPAVQNTLCANTLPALSIRQSDGNVISATSAPHLFLDHD